MASSSRPPNTGTPEMGIDAILAGKDVYLENP